MKYEKIQTKSDIIEISKLFTPSDEEIQREEQADSEPPPTSPSLKLLNAEMPSNEFNSSVPLKMIRTIRVPKITPNLLKRVHHVQMIKDLNVSAVKHEVPSESSSSNKESLDFVGFSNDKDDILDVGRWEKLINTPKEEIIDSTPDKTPIAIEKRQPKAKRIVASVSKVKILENLKKTMVQNVEKPPEHIEAVNESTIESIVPEFQIVTSTPMVVKKNTIIKSDRTPQHSSSIKNSSWQDDIFAVIGSKRIDEIDENLKEIPNLVTGNAIETENVEFKLIINHLKRLLGVKTIKETLKMKPKNGVVNGKLF